MPLPALNAAERVRYLDFMTVYRPVKSGSQIIGWSIRPLSSTDATPMANVPCNLHRTPNFDDQKAGIVTAKQTNIVTANKVTCQYAVLVEPMDYILVTTRNGDTDWQQVEGAPKRPVRIPHTFFYTTPAKAPKTII
jgi:hypothetical protein